jgi:hypothetical protein
LVGLADLSKWQRDDMVSRIEADPEYGRRVGSHVIELLDHVDSHRKPMMLATVFAAYAIGEIDVHVLNRLNAAAALWGLRMRPRYMHDLHSLTLHNAIERHQGEAEDVTRRSSG